MTGKERIELLEDGLGIVQDDLHYLQVGIVDKFQHLEDTLTHLSNVLFTNREYSSLSPHQDHSADNRHIVSSKTAKLEFSRFVGDDPTEWFSHV